MKLALGTSERVGGECQVPLIKGQKRCQRGAIIGKREYQVQKGFERGKAAEENLG